ncbi:MAG: hypothetical protein HY720_06665 [Planctomycetes bacterium]|nr:hypothetical protein [Planctomycetota bacterium]
MKRSATAFRATGIALLAALVGHLRGDDSPPPGWDRTPEAALDALLAARPGNPDLLLVRARTLEELSERAGRDPRPIVLARYTMAILDAGDRERLGPALERWKAAAPENALPWILDANRKWEARDLPGFLAAFDEACRKPSFDPHDREMLRLRFHLAREGGVVRPSALHDYVGLYLMPWLQQVKTAMVVFASWAQGRLLRGDTALLDPIDRAADLAGKMELPASPAITFMVALAYRSILTSRLAPALAAGGETGRAGAMLAAVVEVNARYRRFGKCIEGGIDFPFDLPWSEAGFDPHLDSSPHRGLAVLEEWYEGGEYEWVLDRVAAAETPPRDRWPTAFLEALPLFEEASWSEDRVDRLVELVRGEGLARAGAGEYDSPHGQVVEAAACTLFRTPETLRERVLEGIKDEDDSPARWIREAFSPGSGEYSPFAFDCSPAQIGYLMSLERAEDSKEFLIDQLATSEFEESRVAAYLALVDLTGEDHGLDPEAWRAR